MKLEFEPMVGNFNGRLNLLTLTLNNQNLHRSGTPINFREVLGIRVFSNSYGRAKVD